MTKDKDRRDTGIFYFTRVKSYFVKNKGIERERKG
jgi:hypothetical protein